MNNYNEREEKKGGFWSALSGLFRGGSSAMGGASSGLGSAGGGLGGLFATKAGILGMVLGGATIAAGVGVVYNFVGPSSKPVYSPELFQESYYEEESSKAGFERAQARNTAAAEPSTLDMFKEQAKKDGLGGLASEASDQDKADASAGAPADGASADSAAPGAPGAEGAGYGSGSDSSGPKLKAGSGFGGKGGSGSGTSMPKMQGNGGLSGGIGGQFQSVYRAPANAGKTSAMTASAARVNSSPKYAVPLGKGKGAYGQAKFAGKMGAKAAYSADGSSARSGATSAFSGETTGAGDVGAAGTGAGLGGAGVSNGSALKGNDPSISSNESTPPAVPEPTKENPWQATEDGIMNAMMWAGGLILVTKLLSGLAKKAVEIPWLSAALYIAAMAAAAAAIFYAVKVIMGGFKMYSTYGQKMMGGLYIVAGIVLIMKAIEALCEAAGGAGSAGTESTKMVDGKSVTINKGGSPVLGGASGFLKGMGGWSSAFDLGSLFK